MKTILNVTTKILIINFQNLLNHPSTYPIYINNRFKKDSKRSFVKSVSLKTREAVINNHMATEKARF